MIFIFLHQIKEEQTVKYRKRYYIRSLDTIMSVEMGIGVLAVIAAVLALWHKRRIRRIVLEKNPNYHYQRHRINDVRRRQKGTFKKNIAVYDAVLRNLLMDKFKGKWALISFDGKYHFADIYNSYSFAEEHLGLYTRNDASLHFFFIFRLRTVWLYRLHRIRGYSKWCSFCHQTSFGCAPQLIKDSCDAGWLCSQTDHGPMDHGPNNTNLAYNVHGPLVRGPFENTTCGVKRRYI